MEKDGFLMSNYQKLDDMFRENQFRKLDEEKNSKKFYFLRSISRRNILDKICKEQNIETSNKTVKVLLEEVFNNDKFTTEIIKEFIEKEYKKEVEERKIPADKLVKELNRVKDFDWGGSFGNSLEKNIVNNYVKKIYSYDSLHHKIENELLASLRGYTINSWYNHWSSILIEDIFKEHSAITPTIGLISKIDFFINDVPFDLKVTYFPEEFMKQKLREKDFGVELTQVKKAARLNEILIDENLRDRALNIQLQALLEEKNSKKSRIFLKELNSLKESIIKESMDNPEELINWLYENQGEARFDASNRFFLILTDVDNIYDSWKLKRNLSLLRSEIFKKMEDITEKGSTKIEFYWEQERKSYEVKADILFISKEKQ